MTGKKVHSAQASKWMLAIALILVMSVALSPFASATKNNDNGKAKGQDSTGDNSPAQDKVKDNGQDLKENAKELKEELKENAKELKEELKENAKDDKDNKITDDEDNHIDDNSDSGSGQVENDADDDTPTQEDNEVPQTPDNEDQPEQQDNQATEQSDNVVPEQQDNETVELPENSAPEQAENADEQPTSAGDDDHIPLIQSNNDGNASHENNATPEVPEENVTETTEVENSVENQATLILISEESDGQYAEVESSAEGESPVEAEENFSEQSSSSQNQAAAGVTGAGVSDVSVSVTEGISVMGAGFGLLVIVRLVETLVRRKFMVQLLCLQNSMSQAVAPVQNFLAGLNVRYHFGKIKCGAGYSKDDALSFFRECQRLPLNYTGHF